MFRFRTNPEFRAPLTAGGSSTFGYLLAAGVGLVVALLVLMAFSASRGSADPRPDSYSLPDDARYPEGIAADNKSGDFYVSSVADGSIYRGNVSNQQAKLFLRGGEDGRTHATGLKLDDGQLYVAGAQTGKVFVYNASRGDLIRRLRAQGAGFLNDLAINPHTGDAYITDSFVPTLWRISGGKLRPWLDLSDTPIHYTPNEFNLNGIVATPDGRYLLTVQSNTGKLYRINTQTKQVRSVGLDDARVRQGDGLVLRGDTLYVVRNQGFVTKVSLNEEFTSGQVKGKTLVPSPEPKKDFPTTAALVRGRLLVVNSQFAEEGPADPNPKVVDLPEKPFRVSSMPAP
jgi:sugar lactone lactonase YvrE